MSTAESAVAHSVTGEQPGIETQCQTRLLARTSRARQVPDFSHVESRGLGSCAFTGREGKQNVHRQIRWMAHLRQAGVQWREFGWAVQIGLSQRCIPASRIRRLLQPCWAETAWPEGPSRKGTVQRHWPCEIAVWLCRLALLWQRAPGKATAVSQLTLWWPGEQGCSGRVRIQRLGLWVLALS